MKCPACENTMTERKVSDIVLDVCDNGCGGIWFDKSEFKKFDEPHEPDADTLLKLNVNKRPTAKAPYSCPRCAPVKLFRHFSSVKRHVSIDSCPKCTGVWLDVGELAGIKQEFSSEAERRAAAETVYSEMFNSEFNTLRAESLDKLRTAQKFAQAFRFISPSYFIPGKQSGGAF